MIKSLSKKLIVATMLMSLSSCGTLFNNNKPIELSSHEELNQALEQGLIENRYSYFVGNILLLPVFGIGFIGIISDIVTNANYSKVDEKAYDNWLKQKEEQKKANLEKLRNSN